MDLREAKNQAIVAGAGVVMAGLLGLGLFSGDTENIELTEKAAQQKSQLKNSKKAVNKRFKSLLNNKGKKTAASRSPASVKTASSKKPEAKSYSGGRGKKADLADLRLQQVYDSNDSGGYYGNDSYYEPSGRRPYGFEPSSDPVSDSGDSEGPNIIGGGGGGLPVGGGSPLISESDGGGGSPTPVTTSSTPNTTLPEDDSPIDFTIVPRYSNNGANWNDYLKGDGTDTACVAAGTDDCVNAGPLRKGVVSGLSSCSYTIEDLLDVFEWSCVASGSSITIYSDKFKPGKGLADLVNSSGWIANKVSIKDGSTVKAESSSVAWWSNPVVALPDNSGGSNIILDGTDDDTTGPDQAYLEGTVFYLGSNMTSPGFNINLDKASLVVENNFALTFDGSADNCTYLTGENGGADDMRCLVSIGSNNFIWIEGKFDSNAATDADNGIYVKLSKYSHLHRVVATGALEYGVYLKDSSFLRVTQSHFNQNTLSGLKLCGVSSSKVRHVNSSNNAGTGISLYTLSNSNLMHGLVVSNNGSHGFYMDASQYNVINKVIANNNGAAGAGSGIRYDAAQYNNLGFVTAMNNAYNGIQLHNGGPGTPDYNVTWQIVSVNNGHRGIYLYASDDGKFANLVLANNADGGFVFEGCGSNDNLFQDNIILGSNGGGAVDDCKKLGAGTNNELLADCSSATATVRQGIDLTSHIVGKVTATDNTNQSNTDGYETHGSISDWHNFNSFFRGWGNDGGAFASAGNRERCTGGTCRIWDMSLKNSASNPILNRSLDANSDNTAFSSGSNCPGAVSGTVTMVDLFPTPNTYLVNAMEIVGDGLGDEDGLCESSESCIYAPNYGAYQGSGDYSGNTCTFVNGTVANVNMSAYPTNGE
jgi:hypothetical protein